MGVLVSWAALTLGLLAASALVPGFEVSGFRGAVKVGFVFGILHFLLGHVLFAALVFSTLFLALLFKTITWWVVSAILLEVTDALTDALTIRSFGRALAGAAILGVVSAVADLLVR